MQTIRRRNFFKALGLAVPGFLYPSQADADDMADFVNLSLPDLEIIRALLKNKEPNVWLFTGDSITHGAKHTAGFRSYPEIFAERIRWEMARTRDWVINTGISSQTTASILDDFDWRVTKFEPSVVSLMIGTNDCSKAEIPPAIFESNLELFVKKVRDLKAIPILHTPNPIILDTSPERKTLPDYIPVIWKVAEKHQVIMVDNYSYWESRHRRNLNNVYKQWLNDRLHPNYKGHQQIARLMFRTLDIFDPEQPTCGGEYYEAEH